MAEEEGKLTPVAKKSKAEERESEVEKDPIKMGESSKEEPKETVLEGEKEGTHGPVESTTSVNQEDENTRTLSSKNVTEDSDSQTDMEDSRQPKGEHICIIIYMYF